MYLTFKSKIKIGCVIIPAIVLAFGLMAVLISPAEATTDTWDGTIAESFAGGSGTFNEPYEIATGAQLAYLAQVINDTTTNDQYRNKHYKLIANLDLGGHEWTPIGLNATYNFGDSGGSFNGNGYTISNLQIGSLSSPNAVYANVGLFGWTTRGTLKNIALDKYCCLFLSQFQQCWCTNRGFRYIHKYQQLLCHRHSEKHWYISDLGWAGGDNYI